VPCIVSWPAHIPQNAVRDQMTISIDWMPTIAEYCGVRLPKQQIDGKSITHVIASADAASPHEVLHWASGNHWAVRQGPWKLVHNGPATEYKGRTIAKVEDFLSNLAEDVTETKNLAAQHPDLVQRLKKLHSEWLHHVQQR